LGSDPVDVALVKSDNTDDFTLDLTTLGESHGRPPDLDDCPTPLTQSELNLMSRARVTMWAADVLQSGDWFSDVRKSLIRFGYTIPVIGGAFESAVLSFAQEEGGYDPSLIALSNSHLRGVSYREQLSTRGYIAAHLPGYAGVRETEVYLTLATQVFAANIGMSLTPHTYGFISSRLVGLMPVRFLEQGLLDIGVLHNTTAYVVQSLSRLSVVSAAERSLVPHVGRPITLSRE